MTDTGINENRMMRRTHDVALNTALVGPRLDVPEMGCQPVELLLEPLHCRLGKKEGRLVAQPFDFNQPVDGNIAKSQRCAHGRIPPSPRRELTASA